MENSYKYFENRACKYYPCHKREGEGFNCLFCYCPMYTREDCLGKPEYWERDGRRIKVCTNCDFPHRPESYEKIMAFLREKG